MADTSCVNRQVPTSGKRSISTQRLRRRGSKRRDEHATTACASLSRELSAWGAWLRNVRLRECGAARRVLSPLACCSSPSLRGTTGGRSRARSARRPPSHPCHTSPDPYVKSRLTPLIHCDAASAFPALLAKACSASVRGRAASPPPPLADFRAAR